MNLQDEIKKIDDFFDMMIDEEFEKMLIECGAERIKSTKDIVSHEKYYVDNIPKYINKKEIDEFALDSNYNDDVERSEAA